MLNHPAAPPVCPQALQALARHATRLRVMQALQAAPPGGALRLDADPPDLFWEQGQQSQTDLDGFLCSLLAEGQVELTAGLVPPTLAARWGLGGRGGVAPHEAAALRDRAPSRPRTPPAPAPRPTHALPASAWWLQFRLEHRLQR